MISVGKSQVVDITPVWHFSITESRLGRSINRNVMLLQQLLPAVPVRQFSSEFFISQQDSAAATGRLRQSTPPPINFAKMFSYLKNSVKTDSAVN